MAEPDRRRLRRILPALAVAIVAVASMNLIMDAPPALSAHVLFELLTYVGALVITGALWLGWWRSHAREQTLRRSLDARRLERDRWRSSARRAMDGAAGAVEDEFAAWDLTPAEREVAVHLLKGHTHKAIARLTDRSERTVRQHAVSIYQKAGLAGRAELAAHFLEGLPAGSAGAAEAEPGARSA